MNLPTVDELIDVTMQPETAELDSWECGCCSASLWCDVLPEWAELVCPECLEDLFDALNPAADDGRRSRWHEAVERMLAS